MTRAAMIGTGFWAARLAEAAARTSLELVACHSPRAEARAAFAERFGCEAAESYEAVLADPRVEAVLLVTPNDLHADQAVAAAAAGKHVFVEKPIAHTVADGERMRDACAAAGVTLLVGHEFRRLGAARKAKELVEGGALGRVVLAEATFSLPGSVAGWKSTRVRSPGLPLVQLGIHHAETLTWLLGPAARASGRLARVAVAADVDDVAVATLEFASGALGTITGSYVSPKTYALRLQGTEAVLEYRTDISVWPAAERLDALTELLLAGARVPFERRDPLAEELEELARCVRGEAEPETGAAEGLAALRVILEAIR